MTQRRKVLLTVTLLSSVFLILLAAYLKIGFLAAVSVALFLVWMKYDPICETSIFTDWALDKAKNISKLPEEEI